MDFASHRGSWRCQSKYEVGTLISLQPLEPGKNACFKTVRRQSALVPLSRYGICCIDCVLISSHRNIQNPLFGRHIQTQQTDDVFTDRCNQYISSVFCRDRIQFFCTGLSELKPNKRVAIVRTTRLNILQISIIHDCLRRKPENALSDLKPGQSLRLLILRQIKSDRLIPGSRTGLPGNRLNGNF